LAAEKNILQPHLKQQWVIPPEANSAFVAAMEDVLAVYVRPRDLERPLVCLDETSKQLIAEMHTDRDESRGARPRCEYERNGTANLFMLFARLEGWPHVKVTERRTAVDYAHVLKDLADVHFSRRQDDRTRPGQSQYLQQGFALRGVSGGRSQTAGRALRMALHAKARQLARSGGIRARRPELPIP
jgi:hypothetical protein